MATKRCVCELDQLARSLGVHLEQHPTSRQFEITYETAQMLRGEHERVNPLHARSMKIAAAARQLGLAVSTVGLASKRGDLTLDAETDSSGARFVTRSSVDQCRSARIARSAHVRIDAATVPLADVIAFPGRSRTELLDLVRAGVGTGPGARTVQAHSGQPSSVDERHGVAGVASQPGVHGPGAV